MLTRHRVLAAVGAVVVLAGCSSSEPPTTAPAPSEATPAGAISLPQGGEPVDLDPAEFGVPITNPYWPMTPGSRWIYRETDAKGSELRVEVTVTSDRRPILGIDATVVHDVVTEDGEPVEDTLDFYAQDRSGNLWYLGEDTKEYENGKVVSTEGSWIGGVDGAQPGIVLPADPQPGMAYRQEYYEGHAEDRGEILRVDEHADVPYGSFDGVLLTKDTTPLEPDLVENKYYARGVGPVLEVTTAGGSDRDELIRFTSG